MASRLTRTVPSTIFRQRSTTPFSSFATPQYTPPSTSRFPISDIRSIRPFSSSSPSWASEAPQSPWGESKSYGGEDTMPLFERLQKHPECMQAITHLATTVQAKTGVNLTGGEKPSLKMMMALASDPELRAAAENLMASLKNAGIEVDPRQAFHALKMMGGEGFEKSPELHDLQEMMKRGEEGDGEGEGESGKK